MLQGAQNEEPALDDPIISGTALVLSRRAALSSFFVF